jgi:hypothetical protein
MSEAELLKAEIDWIHRILRYIDGEEDFSYDRFKYLLVHGGWCPDCERVDDGGMWTFYRGRQLQNPNEDGDYECWICYNNQEEVKA